MQKTNTSYVKKSEISFLIYYYYCNTIQIDLWLVHKKTKCHLYYMLFKFEQLYSRTNLKQLIHLLVFSKNSVKLNHKFVSHLGPTFDLLMN